VAQAEIVIADQHLYPQVAEVYNTCFRPKADAAYFERRFEARHSVLTLLARVGDRPVGFWIGFELKPGVFYHWLGAVASDLRRGGIAQQLQEAMESWARENGYEFVRTECLNAQREFIHFAIHTGYQIVGIRWDSTHSENMVIFEKGLE
jgi:GNAT superfamily N-acetyltransferase